MKKRLVHLATRVFDTPLMIHRAKLDVIMNVLGPRLDVNVEDLEHVQMENGTSRQVLSMPPSQEPGQCVLAIIPICGTLVQRAMGLDALSGLTTYGMIGDAIQAAVEDDTVDAIVLDIDSPGGEVNGVFDLMTQIKAASEVKPVYAIANEYAFSAAYLLASAADKIFIPQTGNVGSIGVIATHVDQSEADKQDGYKFTHVIAGDYKADLSPHAPLSDRAQSKLQDEVTSIYDMFTGAVADNREMTVQQVVNTKAATFLGKSAVNAGLADEVMSATDAINAIAQEVIQMSKEDKQPVAAAPAPTAAAPAADAPVAAAPVTVTDTRDYTAEAAEISEACHIGGMPQLAGEFIRKKLTPQQAKAELFDRKSKGEASIIGAAAPDAGGGPDADADGGAEKLMKAAMGKVNKNQSLAGRGDDVKLY